MPLLSRLGRTMNSTASALLNSPSYFYTAVESATTFGPKESNGTVKSATSLACGSDLFGHEFLSTSKNSEFVITLH
jgi:hypothetical protein